MRLVRVLALALATFAPVSSAFAFDHSKLDALLKAHVSGGKVDYDAVRTKEAELDAYLATVSTASGDLGMGFYINAYNAIVIDALLDSGAALPVNVTDLKGFFDTKKYKVAGRDVTLNDIENGVRSKYKDARVHFAFNCGAKSCPPQRAGAWPEDQAGLSAALDSATKAFFNASGLKVDDTKREIQVTKLMDWYGQDFKDNTGTLEAYLLKFTSDATKAAQLTAAVDGGYAVAFMSYNWNPNKK